MLYIERYSRERERERESERERERESEREGESVDLDVFPSVAGDYLGFILRLRRLLGYF